ncbi:MAG: membrane dipeptidase [Prevotella sp.]|jgi:microsomal dipeptidase-like Zn-dependent dipeptidase/gamma-glutamyl-gamma-aminobutyrate hydrolase PuuD|nr:membrane dipeptidase [Prevotella sp.]
MKRSLSISLLLFYIIFSYHLSAQEKYTPGLDELYNLTDSAFVDLRVEQSPRIGVSASRGSNGGSIVSGAYIESIVLAGGTPVIIPVMTDGIRLRELVKDLDALVLIGGDDVNPSYYKEKPIKEGINVIDSVRDIYELILLKMASDRNVPILGICRGAQLINVAFGGTLYQDIPMQHTDKSVEHMQKEPREKGTHKVIIEKGSKLRSVVGKDDLMTNTFHHQAIKDVAPEFVATAKTTDGLVEAIEAYPNRKIMAVQWHPESHAIKGDAVMLKIFSSIVDEATVYRHAKKLHEKMLSVDTHCDTPLEFKNTGFNIGKREVNQVNIPKMEEGKLDAIFFAAYQAQGPRDVVSSKKAVERVDQLIKDIYNQVEKNKDICGIAFTTNDLIRLKSEEKKAIFIGIENGYGIGKDISNIERFKKLGVNYITLCHTKDNDICDTSSTTNTNNEWNGLSPFGKDVIREMNRLGVMIDVSHVGEKTFWDVIELSSQPIIASHSSVQSLCYHNRNLTDKQIKAVAQNGGVVQICFVDLFVNKEPAKASLEDAVNHIDYAMKIAGIDHVGIASDFDGGGGVIGCRGSNDMINITMKLIDRGYSDEDIIKIWGGNFLRVMDKVQSGTKK